MKFSRVLFAILLLVIFVLGILALPRFTVSVGGRDFTWPAIDFTLFDAKSPWGNFRRGTGLYSSNQFRFQATFTADQKESRDAIFADDVNLIRRRMEAASLYDVELTTDVSGDNYQFVISFPDYYHEVDMERVALLLIQPGNISILEHNTTPAEGTQPDAFLTQYYPGYTPKISSLVGVKDIANISIETRAVLGGSVWRVHFADSATTNLAEAVTAGNYSAQTAKPLMVAIDNNPVMILVSIGQAQDMLGRPFDTRTDYTELRVMASYLLGNVGIRTQYTELSSTQQQAIYGEQGKTITAISIILSAVVLGLLALRRFGRRGAFAFTIGLSAYVLLSVVVFKLLAVSLSIGFILGFLSMYALGAFVMFDLLRTEESLVRDALLKYRNLGLLLMFITGALYVSNIGFGTYMDVLGAVAMMGLVLAACCLLIFSQTVSFIFANQDK